MSRIFEAFQHAEEERLQRSAEEQRGFQGRISERTGTDRRSASTCSRISSRQPLVATGKTLPVDTGMKTKR
jgi:hypothetical protein